MTSTPAPARPAGVTLVVILTYLAGLLDILGGIVLMITRNDAATEADAGLHPSGLLTLGIAEVLLGIFIVLLAGALGRGSAGARLIVSFVMVARLLVGIWGTIAIHSVSRWSHLLEAVIAAIVLLLLWSAAASGWFRDHQR